MTSEVAIICLSVHHGNTRRVAAAMSEELSADLFAGSDIDEFDVTAYKVVGIGSGIYFGRHHSAIRKLVASWPQPPTDVFVFSTAGLPFLRYFQHGSLRRALRRRGCRIIGEFCCRGWDTVGPLWLMGGINRKRPGKRDLMRARKFAASIRSQPMMKPDFAEKTRIAHP